MSEWGHSRRTQSACFSGACPLLPRKRQSATKMRPVVKASQAQGAHFRFSPDSPHNRRVAPLGIPANVVKLPGLFAAGGTAAKGETTER
jgi:hypothetical protein